jgi:chromosome partitioning protein
VKIIKQAQSVRLGPPQAVMFRLPCGKRDKAQNRSNGIVRETCTHPQAVLKSVIHQKQVIADSSRQAATV